MVPEPCLALLLLFPINKKVSSKIVCAIYHYYTDPGLSHEHFEFVTRVGARVFMCLNVREKDWVHVIDMIQAGCSSASRYRTCNEVYTCNSVLAN